MDYTTVAVGLVAVGFGAYTAYLRKSKPESFGKLDAMKQFWGETAGTVLHVTAYSLFPIGFGCLLVWAGSLGISLSTIF